MILNNKKKNPHTRRIKVGPKIIKKKKKVNDQEDLFVFQLKRTIEWFLIFNATLTTP